MLAGPAFTGTAAASNATGGAGTHYFPIHRVSTGAGTAWGATSYANPGGWISTADRAVPGDSSPP